MNANHVSRFVAGPLSAIALAGLLMCAHCSGEAGAPEPAAARTGAVASALQDEPAPVVLCADKTNVLCSFLPKDNPFRQSMPAYRTLTAVDERVFDNYAWQTFVALNWPADDQGKPSTSSITARPEGKRVWESYATISDVFDASHAAPAACADAGDAPIMDFNFTQVGERPLVDQNGNFVVYDVRMNPIEVSYIRDNGLATLAGQRAFAAKDGKVDFPVGYYDDVDARTGGRDPAIEIKSAWRILDPAKDDASRFFTVERRVYVPAEASATKADQCFAAKLGMVAFHVMAKTTTEPHPQHWMWPSFEHVDNAPLAESPTPQTSATMGACAAPTGARGGYSFFDPACKGAACTPNQAPDTSRPILWADRPPYATGLAPAQVVRCWDDFPETAEVNAVYQAALAGSPFRNYRLVATQWDAKPDHYQDTPISLPNKMSNAVLETFNQNSSCIGCHESAHTSALSDANYSFLLRHAR